MPKILCREKLICLLVDDDANTLASLSRAFRLAGHEATVCDNAGARMDLLRTEKFDLIFSDVVMPGKERPGISGRSQESRREDAQSF